MRRIYKYDLELLGYKNVAVSMPTGARVFTVQTQFNMPRIWADVDPNAPLVRRIFRVLPTGGEMDARGPYVGTFQLDGGALVFHVFDEGELG